MGRRKESGLNRFGFVNAFLNMHSFSRWQIKRSSKFNTKFVFILIPGAVGDLSEWY